MESNCYTTNSESYSYELTHLDRMGSGAIVSNQEEPCLAFAHCPSSLAPLSHCRLKPNTSTEKKHTQCYTHCAPGHPSPEPVRSTCTLTMWQSWQHVQRKHQRPGNEPAPGNTHAQSTLQYRAPLGVDPEARHRSS